MKKERISHVIGKVSHWPPKKRLEYLSLTYQTERDYHRRAKIYAAMRDLRTNTMKQELRNERS